MEYKEVSWESLTEQRYELTRIAAEEAQVSSVEADLLLRYFHYQRNYIIRFGQDRLFRAVTREFSGIQPRPPSCFIPPSDSDTQCEPSSSSSSDANGELNQPTSSATVASACLICEADAYESLHCGHKFCHECWYNYLNVNIRHWNTFVTCPWCHVAVDILTCSKYLAPHKFQLLTRWLDEDFIADMMANHDPVTFSLSYRRCPGPSCERIICRTPRQPYTNNNPNNLSDQSRSPPSEDFSGVEETMEYTCECGCIFCFTCGLSSHQPLPCELARKWLELVNYIVTLKEKQKQKEQEQELIKIKNHNSKLSSPNTQTPVLSSHISNDVSFAPSASCRPPLTQASLKHTLSRASNNPSDEHEHTNILLGYEGNIQQLQTSNNSDPSAANRRPLPRIKPCPRCHLVLERADHLLKVCCPHCQLSFCWKCDLTVCEGWNEDIEAKHAKLNVNICEVEERCPPNHAPLMFERKSLLLECAEELALYDQRQKLFSSLLIDLSSHLAQQSDPSRNNPEPDLVCVPVSEVSGEALEGAAGMNVGVGVDTQTPAPSASSDPLPREDDVNGPGHALQLTRDTQLALVTLLRQCWASLHILRAGCIFRLFTVPPPALNRLKLRSRTRVRSRPIPWKKSRGGEEESQQNSPIPLPGWISEERSEGSESESEFGSDASLGLSQEASFRSVPNSRADADTEAGETTEATGGVAMSSDVPEYLPQPGDKILFVSSPPQPSELPAECSVGELEKAPSVSGGVTEEHLPHLGDKILHVSDPTPTHSHPDSAGQDSASISVRSDPEKKLSQPIHKPEYLPQPGNRVLYPSSSSSSHPAVNMRDMSPVVKDMRPKEKKTRGRSGGVSILGSGTDTGDSEGSESETDNQVQSQIQNGLPEYEYQTGDKILYVSSFTASSASASATASLSSSKDETKDPIPTPLNVNSYTTIQRGNKPLGAAGAKEHRVPEPGSVSSVLLGDRPGFSTSSTNTKPETGSKPHFLVLFPHLWLDLDDDVKALDRRLAEVHSWLRHTGLDIAGDTFPVLATSAPLLLTQAEIQQQTAQLLSGLLASTQQLQAVSKTPCLQGTWICIVCWTIRGIGETRCGSNPPAELPNAPKHSSSANHRSWVAPGCGACRLHASLTCINHACLPEFEVTQVGNPPVAYWRLGESHADYAGIGTVSLVGTGLPHTSNRSRPVLPTSDITYD